MNNNNEISLKQSIILSAEKSLNDIRENFSDLEGSLLSFTNKYYYDLPVSYRGEIYNGLDQMTNWNEWISYMIESLHNEFFPSDEEDDIINNKE